MVGSTLCVVCLSPPLLRFLVPADLRLLPLAHLPLRLGPLGRWTAIMSLGPSPNLCPAGWPGRPAPPWHLAGGVGFLLSPYIIVDLSSPPQLPGQRASEFFLAFLYSTERLLHHVFFHHVLAAARVFNYTDRIPYSCNSCYTLVGGWLLGGGGGLGGFQIPRLPGATVENPLGAGVSWAASWAICPVHPCHIHYRTSFSNLYRYLSTNPSFETHLPAWDR